MDTTRPDAPRTRRVLAVRLDNLGDLLMSTPALAALRAAPGVTHLTLLTSPAGAAAAPHLPMLDTVWPFTAPWMPGAADDGGAAERTLLQRLAESRFDAAVIFTVCTQSALPMALLCRMAGIPVRAAHSRENAYGLLTHALPETDSVVPGRSHAEQQQAARHEVLRQLALAAVLGGTVTDDRLRFTVHAADRWRVAQQLQAAALPSGTRYAVLHPGATAASRRWPAALFGSTARRLAASGIAVVFAGGPADEAAVQTALMEAGPGAFSLAGRQTLGELAALIEGAAVLVANNSAAAHLAAAVGTPVVDLYALTNPQHTPWRVPARVLYQDVPCRWCLKSTCPLGNHACLLGVQPQQVAVAALELMRPPAPAPARPAAPTETPA